MIRNVRCLDHGECRTRTFPGMSRHVMLPDYAPSPLEGRPEQIAENNGPGTLRELVGEIARK